jgi:pyruvate kinase
MLQLQRGSARAPGGETPVLAVPAVENALRLHKDDVLVLTRQGPGRPARLDAQGRVVRPASIPCTLPEVLAQVHPGERVWFDDGRIGGVIRHVQREEVHVQITVAREGGEKLAADKGINLPDSTLELAALTAKDLEDLDFVARHADLVGLSFVRRVGDIERLQEHLSRLDAGDVGIVLKIENRIAFEHLPDLLLAGMHSRRLGVMIARGDLAVEMGWERLAEVQEEILWLAEAAHVPVIWATQVLETLAKRGLPSRAEITDAAMGERAECVMLNKGPHILEAIEALDDILSRMQAHQHKKRAMLRRLHW